MELFYKELPCAYDRYIFNAFANLVATGAGLVNDDINRDWNAEEAEKNRQFQREEREASQQFNIDMWNMNNEYNSFKAQAERAREAGFAPDAILGNQSNSQPVVTAPQPGAQASFNSSMSPVLAGLPGAIAQIDLAEAQKQNINEDTRSKQNENNFFTDTYEDRIKQIHHQTKTMQLEKLIKDKELEKIGIDVQAAQESFNWLAKLNEVEYKTRMANLNNAYIAYKNSVKQGNLIDKQSKYYEELASTEDYKQEGMKSDNAVAALKAAVSKETGLPLGSPEHEFQYLLLINDKLQEYCDSAIVPIKHANMKPQEWIVTEGETKTEISNFGASGNLFGVEVGGIDNKDESSSSHSRTYDVRRSQKSPELGPRYWPR